jgi:hypothetical protein
MKDVLRIDRLARYTSALFLFTSIQILSNQVLLEFKTAYFVPVDKHVRAIFDHGGALFGPEITFQLCENNNWYGFASIDFLTKKGRSIGLCNRTHMRTIPLGFGVKYMVPFCYADFYVGAGIQPIHLKTVNCSPFVMQKTSKWGVGAIFKVGAYINLPHNFCVDLFFDYTISRIGCDKCVTSVIPLRVELDGVLFGMGLGYWFD